VASGEQGEQDEDDHRHPTTDDGVGQRQWPDVGDHLGLDFHGNVVDLVRAKDVG